MDIDAVRAVLKNEVAKAGGQKMWAEKHGVSPAYVSEVLRETAEPGVKILDALGFERIAQYKRRKAIVSPSMVDCSQEHVRKDARHELRCAEGSISTLGAWANRWGDALLDGYEHADRTDEVEKLEREINQVEDDLSACRGWASEAEIALQSFLADEDISDARRSKLNDILDNIGRATS